MPPQQWMGHLRVSERQREFAVWPPSLRFGGENDAICAPINSVKWWEGKELGWPGFAAIEQRISDLYSPPLQGDLLDLREVEWCVEAMLSSQDNAPCGTMDPEKNTSINGRKCGRFLPKCSFWTAQMKLFTKVRADRQGSNCFGTWSEDLKRLDSPLYRRWITEVSFLPALCSFDVASNSSWTSDRQRNLCEHMEYREWIPDLSRT